MCVVTARRSTTGTGDVTWITFFVRRGRQLYKNALPLYKNIYSPKGTAMPQYAMLGRAQMAADEGRGPMSCGPGAHHQQAVPAIGTGHAQAFHPYADCRAAHRRSQGSSSDRAGSRGNSSSCPSKRAWRRAPARAYAADAGVDPGGRTGPVDIAVFPGQLGGVGDAVVLFPRPSAVAELVQHREQQLAPAGPGVMQWGCPPYARRWAPRTGRRPAWRRGRHDAHDGHARHVTGAASLP